MNVSASYHDASTTTRQVQLPLSSSDQLKLSLYFSVLDRLLSELKERFLLS